MYPQSMFVAKIRKISNFIHLKIDIFCSCKNHSLLHGRVSVMSSCVVIVMWLQVALSQELQAVNAKPVLFKW